MWQRKEDWWRLDDEEQSGNRSECPKARKADILSIATKIVPRPRFSVYIRMVENTWWPPWSIPRTGPAGTILVAIESRTGARPASWRWKSIHHDDPGEQVDPLRQGSTVQTGMGSGPYGAKTGSAVQQHVTPTGGLRHGGGRWLWRLWAAGFSRRMGQSTRDCVTVLQLWVDECCEESRYPSFWQRWIGRADLKFHSPARSGGRQITTERAQCARWWFGDRAPERRGYETFSPNPSGHIASCTALGPVGDSGGPLVVVVTISQRSSIWKNHNDEPKSNHFISE